MGQRGISIYYPWFRQGLGPRFFRGVLQDSELEDVAARALGSGLGVSLKL